MKYQPADADASLGRSLAPLQAFLHDSVGALTELYRLHGRLAVLNMDGQHLVFAFGPECNRIIYSNNDLFYVMPGFPGSKRSAQRTFGRGLFGLNGEPHVQQRRLLMPPFRKEEVDSYHGYLCQEIDSFLGGWSAGRVIDLGAEMKDLALRVSSGLLFGLDDLTQAHAVSEVFEEWLALNHEAYFRAILPLGGDPAACYERLIDVGERLQDHLRLLVKQRADQGGKNQDLLGILLQAQRAGHMSEADVIGHTHTLFNAAFHTTTASMTWTHFLLAQHPESMSQLHQEVRSTVGTAVPTLGQLGRMPTLERVIRESLRILSPVVYALRVNMEPVVLGSHLLPRGSMIVTSNYLTHHLPELFPDPEAFCPDRWLTQTASPYAYLPFGAGARMCVGAPLALLLMRLVVVRTAQRFRLRVSPGARIDRHCTLTLGHQGPIRVEIHPADGCFQASPVEGNLLELVRMPAMPRQMPRAA